MRHHQTQDRWKIKKSRKKEEIKDRNKKGEENRGKCK